ncbi:MAG: DNA polymerase III subunit delta [Cycloclasticus sp. symbiont of Poecilosclerida sp. M]|nr:MAG: DNA polymerase III subunit delta [Cycloclasticus sp. symbiont of Poecilosclerida sp. M]
MKVDVSQLAKNVQKSLASVYLVSGDEPLQLGESVGLIRKQVRANGFSNRIVLDGDVRFDWKLLAAACMSQSLFAEKNLIELNLPTAKPGKEGSAAIVDIIGQLSGDNVLIIIAGKLDATAKKSRWFKAIESQGVVVQIWPIEGVKLVNWLKQRLQQKQLKLNDESVKFLMQCVEGNLLSAAQEIEKLHVLYGSAELSLEQITLSIADNSRYDVFKLTDSMLLADASRVMHILKALRAEKIAAAVVLWALSREIRILSALSFEKSGSGRLDKVFQKHRIWDSKKAVYLKTITRGRLAHWHGLLQCCSDADLMIKGLKKGNEWLVFEQICLGVCCPERVKDTASAIII